MFLTTCSIGCTSFPLPMRVRFRGITVREVAPSTVRPAGVNSPRSRNTGRLKLHTGWPRGSSPLTGQRLPHCGSGSRSTPPFPPARRAGSGGAGPVSGARTAKVKVAEPGQTLADDVARVEAVRRAVPTVRVDANGGWTVDQAVAAAHALTVGGPLEYIEQPCRSVAELAEVRRRVQVKVAADESIRKASDPLAVVRAHAADIAVLKVAPLGGVRPMLDIAEQIDIPVVVSSALDSAVGIGTGLAAAAALPRLEHACGLGTGGLFIEDVAELNVVDGHLPVVDVVPDPARLAALAAAPDRRDWWITRVRECFPPPLLAQTDKRAKKVE